MNWPFILHDRDRKGDKSNPYNITKNIRDVLFFYHLYINMY